MTPPSAAPPSSWWAARARSGRLPDFPWDTIADEAALARAHPDGVVDLSVGTPVDPVPEVVQRALSDAADAPGYPTTLGTAALRESAARWLARRLGVRADPATEVLPTIGSKELVAWLPTLLGLGPGDVVVVPELAYPTYEVGARLAGAEPVRSDALTALGPRRVALVWVNSPSNPTGRVLPAEHLRQGGGLGAASAARSSCPTSATPSWGGRSGRCRCCTRTCAAGRTRGCSRCTRCPSAPTWPATARGSWPVTPRSSARCSRRASTPG